MQNKIAILIINYKTDEFTNKLVNQLKFYDNNLYDLTVIDNSEVNRGYDQTVVEWLKKERVKDYAGYWLLNNDIVLDLESDYLNKFLEYIKSDEEIAMISTKVVDEQPYMMPQKLNYSEPHLVKYTDFQSVILTNTFVHKLNLENINYFFGGLDFDFSIFANKLNLKILIDYRYAIHHNYHKSVDKGEPIEDLKNHIRNNNLNVELNGSLDDINGKLIVESVLLRYPEIYNRKADSNFTKCTTLKHEMMNNPPVHYAQAEFNKGISLYNSLTYEESKKHFIRAYIAGMADALGYIIGAANYTNNYSNISEILEPYVNRKAYGSERQAYEYITTQNNHFNISDKENKTIVFYVRPDAGHAWDSQHTENGIGGSEIAVINLSKELAKANQNVFVFNRCHTPGTYDGVTWDNINNFDSFEQSNTIDVLIVSRLPEFRFVNPKTQVYFWAHDLNYYQRLTPSNWQYFDKFLVLSRYHYRFFSNAYPWIPKDRFEIISNGLDLERFEQKVYRNPKKLIYSSNPDRGLTQLFDIFEELHKWDSELELHVFGYYPDSIRKHPTYWKEMPGVIYRGYHDQYALAAEYLSSKLWLYPCTWLETFCITALEAQAAGTPAVVSEWGPMRERVGNAGIIIDGFTKENEHKQKFIEAIKTLLTDEKLWNKYSLVGKQQVQQFTWKNSAQQLINLTNKCRY
jgi:glycosyltransferase involved in cell wall biosynthesis